MAEGPAESPQGATFVDEPPPAGASPMAEEDPSVGQRLVGRFMGTDVEEDPMEFTRMGTTIAGATMGAALGSKTPVAPGALGLVINPITGALAFGGVGALMGAAMPEGTMELGEAMGLLPEGTREREGLSPEDLRTVAEGEVLLELATGGMLTMARIGGRGVAKFATASSGDSRLMAEAAARQGIALMPVQVGNGQIARGYVFVMGRLPWLRGDLKKHGQAAEDAIQLAFRGAPERIAPVSAWSEISEKIFRDAGEFMAQSQARFGKLYEGIFTRADELGVKVIPQATLSKAEEILAKLAAQTPTTAAEALGVAGARGTPGTALQSVEKFIRLEILTLATTVGPRGRATAKQSFRQMDGIISKIDQKIATLEPSERRFAASLLKQLRQAAQLDMVTNVRGMNGDEIARALKELDAEFSHTMSEIFETATAKKFGTVVRGGLRHTGFDEATRTPVDQIARTIVKLESPQAIEELSRLVTPETFSRIVAKLMDDAVQVSTKSTGGDINRFDVFAFEKHLGLQNATSNKRKSIARMLELSGSPLTIKDLDELIETAKAIASVEIPNVSAFLARSAALKGSRGLINSVVPGLALTSATGGAAYVGGTFIGMAAFIGGGRMISAIISNPDSARALVTVLDKEASRLVRREAVVRGLRLGIETLLAQEYITGDEASELRRVAAALVDAFDRQIQDLAQ